MKLSVNETCPCGATLRLDGDYLGVASQHSAWQKHHAGHAFADCAVKTNRETP